MNAIVSGRSGRALIIDGESLKSVEADDPATFVPRKRSDLPYLFGDAADLRIVENTTTESVVSLLTADVNFTLALDLTLISLDAELEADIRREALEGVEELFADSKTLERVEYVMYSHPVPDDGDLAGALEICSSELELVSRFLQQLEAHQSAITEVDLAWEAIPTKNFDGYENRQAFRRVAVQEGLFHALATNDSPASISAFLLKALSSPIQRLPNYRQVIQAWLSPFRQSRETPKISREEEKDTFSEPERFSKRGAKLDRRAVLREVQKKKSVIVSAMRSRDLARVYDLVDDLVAFHLIHSESQHTAKSLCDLAMEAEAVEISSLQLALTERSINIAPGDRWSWIQHADALLKVDRLDEALEASDRAIAFGGGAVAKSGRAEVLKAKGQFDAALAAYEEVISEYPEHVIAKNGRAEVLKAQGQFEAALVAYEEVISQHPEDVVAKSGRAEVLKSQGQFDAALAAYEEVISQHPGDVVARNGRAEILKSQGQFDAALAAYEEVLSQHPENVVAKNGRADVLKTKGEFEAALTAYDEVIRKHPEDIFAQTGRAEALKAKGEFEAALTAYDEVIRQHPGSIVAKSGRAEVLKALGQFEAALVAYDEVIRSPREDAVARNGRSSVLVALHRYQEALDSLPKVEPGDRQGWIAHHIRGMILLRLGRLSEAISIFNEGIRNSPLPSDKEYFREALALVWLRDRQFQNAGEVLEEIASPILQPSANVIRIHVFGAQGKFGRALKAYEDLATTPLHNDELTQELHHQYVLGQKPRKDDEWIFDREVKIFLRAA